MLKSIGIAFTFAVGASLAQTPQFEAASLKADKGEFIGGVSGRFGGGPGTTDPIRFRATQVALKILLMLAYDKSSDQISGPDSLDERFTITATMAPGTTTEQFHSMLQNLIVERFHMVFHHETNEVPGYDLVIAPGGFKLKPWEPENNVVPGKPLSGVDAQGFPRLGSAPGRAVFSFDTGGGGMNRSVRRQTMQGFAKGLGGFINLSNGVPREEKTPHVADKTGLTGIYEIKLAFMARALNAALASSAANDSPIGAEYPGGPDIFTALQKDLGLKLVKAKNVPVEVMVIDHVDKVPAEN